MLKRILLSATVLACPLPAMADTTADIISTTGLTVVTAPSVVTGDFIINSGGALPSQLIFPEKQDFTLLNPLVTDTGTIAAGTIINSYFFAVNSSVETFVNTSVTFGDPVLGIIYQDGLDPYGPNPGPFNPNFALSNFLGAVGTTYSLGGANCGTWTPRHSWATPHSFTTTIRVPATSRASSLPIPHQFPVPSLVLACPA
jgi:hypothetical protein